jgi:hypothetical protein
MLQFSIYESASAQNIAINTTGFDPAASAMLDIQSNNRGLLIPQVSLISLTDGATVATPAHSLLIYNTNAALTDGKGYYYNAGTTASPQWVKLAVTGTSWKPAGNMGTTPGTDFVGTTDARGLMFKTNNIQSGYIDLTGTQNTSFGVQSLVAGGGLNNVAIGWNALKANNMGNSNVAIGSNSLVRNKEGQNNIAIGSDALRFDSIGNTNVAIGGSSLYNNLGDNNTAVGYISLHDNSTGLFNIAIGNRAGYYNTTASNQIFFNSLDRSNYTGDTTGSPIYIQQNTTVASQRIKLNGKIIMQSLPAGAGTKAVRIDEGGNLYVADTTMANAGLGWGITGTAGITATNFIGTTDCADFVIKTQSSEIARFSGDRNYKIAFGLGNISSGNYSIAMGRNNTASGLVSLAVGYGTTASGNNSTAFGNTTFATGNYSTAFGAVTYASGSYSTAFGSLTKSKSFAGLVIGINNDSANASSSTSFSFTNRVFQIGIGISDESRANAMTVLFNGKTGIGTTLPDSLLTVEQGIYVKRGVRFSGLPTSGTYYKSVRVTSDGTFFLADTTVSGWSKTGNAGTTAGTDFIGTTDAKDLVIKTNGSSRINISSAGVTTIGDGNNNTKIEADGSLLFEGSATTFGDLTVPLYNTKPGEAGSQPAWIKMKDNGAGSSGVYTYSFAGGTEQEVFFYVQLPHNWKEGSTIYPHVHWSPQTTGQSGTLVWGIEYSWVNYDAASPEAFPNTTLLTAVSAAINGTANNGQHLITPFASLTPDNSQNKMSSVLMCRFYRKGGDAADTYNGNAAVLFVDFHYEIDAIGSHTEYIK